MEQGAGEKADGEAQAAVVDKGAQQKGEGEGQDKQGQPQYGGKSHAAEDQVGVLFLPFHRCQKQGCRSHSGGGQAQQFQQQGEDKAEQVGHDAEGEVSPEHGGEVAKELEEVAQQVKGAFQGEEGEDGAQHAAHHPQDQDHAVLADGEGRGGGSRRGNGSFVDRSLGGRGLGGWRVVGGSCRAPRRGRLGNHRSLRSGGVFVYRGILGSGGAAVGAELSPVIQGLAAVGTEHRSFLLSLRQHIKFGPGPRRPGERGDLFWGQRPPHPGRSR